MKFEFSPKPERQIGVGGYKRAYLAERNGRKEVHLVLKNPYTEGQMKSIFYLNKIARALFPEHVVAVTQTGNAETKDTGATSHVLTEFVEPDPGHRALQREALTFGGDYEGYSDSSFLDPEEDARIEFGRLSKERQKYLESPEISAFLAAYEKSGLIAGPGARKWGPHDLILKKDGGFIFVDVDVAWEEPKADGRQEHDQARLLFNPVALQESINALEDPRRKEAQDAYDRLLTLCREAGISTT